MYHPHIVRAVQKSKNKYVMRQDKDGEGVPGSDTYIYIHKKYFFLLYYVLYFYSSGFDIMWQISHAITVRTRTCLCMYYHTLFFVER